MARTARLDILIDKSIDLSTKRQSLLNVTSQHAIRAVVYIAQHVDDAPVLARDIAEHTHVPFNYLQKVLRELVRVGVLQSVRGHGGGFTLDRPAEEIYVKDVFAAFDDQPPSGKDTTGDEESDSQDSATLHDAWKPVVDAYEHFLTCNTIAQVIECIDVHDDEAN